MRRIEFVLFSGILQLMINLLDIINWDLINL